MHQPKILMLDTSAINRLADDEHASSLIADLRSGFHVLLPFIAISEVIASTKQNRRLQLARLCRELMSFGDCIDPQNVLLEKLIRAFETNASFDWRRVDVRFPEAIQGLHSEDFDNNLAKQEREESRAGEGHFVEVYDKAKPAFKKLFSGGTEPPKTPGELVTLLQRPGGAFWAWASDLYGRVGKQPMNEMTIREFTAKCDPFRSLLVALSVAHYDRCMRPSGIGPSLRSGRSDTFMAVCLPYCHQFVTDDAGQLACYREVVRIGDLQVDVHSYDEFRGTLFRWCGPTAA